MSKGIIVVIEDDPAIRRGVVDALRLTGYIVFEAADGRAGLESALSPGVDLVLLDLLLPDQDGLDLLAAIRRDEPTRPVIILTARGTEEDRVRGLNQGADDYVVKPFSARELLARVEAVLRRASPPAVPLQQVCFGAACIQLARREIVWHGRERIELSETEAILLQYLLEQRQRVVPREELLTRLWGIASTTLETRTIDMHIARLRAKLRDPAGRSGPEAILTVRGRGYMAGPEFFINESA